MDACLRLRRDEVGDIESVLGLLASVWRKVDDLCEGGVYRGGSEAGFRKTIDFFVHDSGWNAIDTRRGRVAKRAVDDDDVAFLPDVELCTGILGGTNGAGMQEREVRLIQQVLVHRNIVRLHMEVTRNALPKWVAQPMRAWHQGFIGLVRISHPNSHQRSALDDWKCADARIRRHDGHGGHVDAMTRWVELHAVVAADKDVSHKFPLGERERTMGTNVAQCNRPTPQRSVKRDVHSE